ncbi:uncharacterized protein LOC105446939 [Strongylocentrotus purpuratus]|uniref:Uncharacterized protein n=1 Tax=Strongylocentrotus purpuratus TaxID=7668 RepID=A0A7M7P900_STRPU|nr:uncharacterized protein LOC105446939 [Strongylocentrotus purpuratus]
MQGPSEKNIPNFNKRKRPCQALYAFPGKGSQNTDSGGTPSSAPYIQHQQTFSGSNQYTGHGTNDGWQGANNSVSHLPSGEGRTGGWQGTNKSVHQRTNTTSNRPWAPSLPYQQSNQHNMNQGPPQQQSGNMKQLLRPWQQKYNEPSPAKTYRPSASPAVQSSNVQSAQRYVVGDYSEACRHCLKYCL